VNGSTKTANRDRTVALLETLRGGKKGRTRGWGVLLIKEDQEEGSLDMIWKGSDGEKGN